MRAGFFKEYFLRMRLFLEPCAACGAILGFAQSQCPEFQGGKVGSKKAIGKERGSSGKNSDRFGYLNGRDDAESRGMDADGATGRKVFAPETPHEA